MSRKKPKEELIAWYLTTFGKGSSGLERFSRVFANPDKVVLGENSFAEYSISTSGLTHIDKPRLLVPEQFPVFQGPLIYRRGLIFFVATGEDSISRAYATFVNSRSFGDRKFAADSKDGMPERNQAVLLEGLWLDSVRSLDIYTNGLHNDTLDVSRSDILTHRHGYDPDLSGSYWSKEPHRLLRSAGYLAGSNQDPVVLARKLLFKKR